MNHQIHTFYKKKKGPGLYKNIYDFSPVCTRLSLTIAEIKDQFRNCHNYSFNEHDSHYSWLVDVIFHTLVNNEQGISIKQMSKECIYPYAY
ncbi:hypothetical protein ECANGB1_77 [Enterospora canceri]|uniref:Uncharacterized protein n=1 Tax=Enterospora canceri TaxID=1081671 RepID=A0A1Y1S3M4_9MICR|nr:hypothetical protein ECANGB1_77 [Enterospora canceri]